MKWNLGKKIGAAFAVGPALLIVVGIVNYHDTEEMMTAARERRQVFFTLIDLERVVSDMNEAAAVQRGYLLTGENAYLEAFQTKVRDVGIGMKRLRQQMAGETGQNRRLDALDRMAVAKIEILKERSAWRQKKGAGAVAAAAGPRGENVFLEEFRALASEITGEQNTLLQKWDSEVRTTTERTRLLIVLLTSLSAIAFSAVGLMLVRNITAPVREITGTAERIAAGDLGVTIPTATGDDEIGDLSRVFTRMVASLQEMAGAARRIASNDLTVQVKPQSERDSLGNSFVAMVANLRGFSQQIREATNVLASSSNEILAATTQVAAGASETATAVSQTTVTVEEVRQTAQVSSQKAKHVSESAQRVADVSRSGKKAVEQAIDGMSQIRKQMEFIAESIARLSEQTQAIGEVIGTVNDLAEQSNLLAVNAAIEAAKAGEQGKGFAVVAQEIKALAEQSKQGTSQVRSILSEIQKATGRAVMAAEQGSKAVEAGVKQTAESGASIGALAENVLEAAQAATLIATSSQQQLVGVDQVASAMENIKQASAQNVASTKQVETAAQNLNKLGQTLKDLVSQVRI